MEHESFDTAAPAPSPGYRETYLDYAAATPLAPEALEAMMPYLTERFHNPSAPYERGRQAKRALEGARSTLARLIGARPGNVVLTAGATEANNLALATASEGGVVTSAIEHESVLAAARARGASLVGVGPDGRVDPCDVAAAIGPSTQLVSVALANGEIGTIQPVRKIAKVVAAERRRRADAGETLPLWLHTDASQALATCSVNVSSLGADLVTLSAAKVYGPKQVGLLWAADGVILRPLVFGGGQERGVRSGTENVAGVVGFAKAAELACACRDEEARRLEGLRNLLEGRIVGRFPWAQVTGPCKPRLRLPGLLHVSFPGLEAARLVIALERRGVSVGTGSACAASRMRKSHVLAAIGASDEVAAGSLRITLGRPTTREDVDYAADAICQAVSAEARRVGLDAGGVGDGR